MSQILIYFFIALSLSMDAFSVSLSLGTLKPTSKTIFKMGIVVGIFHFIMPIIGSIVGRVISDRLYLNANYIVSIIFIILALEMFFTKDDATKTNTLSLSTILIIALSVSIDSLSIGFALSLLKNSIIIPSIIFSITSGIFTIIGLVLVKKIKNRFNKTATYLGILILLLLAIKYLFF